MKFRSVLLVLVCTLVAAPLLALTVDPAKTPDARLKTLEPAKPRGVTVDLEADLPEAAAARSFIGRRGGTWKVQADSRTGRPTLVQGSGVPLVPGRGNALDVSVLAGLPAPAGEIAVETLAPLVDGFVKSHGAWLEPPVGRLVLDSATSLMRDRGRLASLYYQWTVGDVPVEGAYVYVRLNSGNITQFGAPLIGDAALDPTPALDAGQAAAKLMSYSGDGEVHRLREEPELLFQVEENIAGELRYRLVWKVTYTVPDRIETWEGRVDARSGEVVTFRDTNQYARAVGGVYPRTVLDDNETRVPLGRLDVVVGGSTQTADDAGAFSYSGGTITSGLNGRWFNTSCQSCTGPSQPFYQKGLGIGWIDFGEGGADEIGNGFSTPADRNTFYQLNQVRRLGLKWLPTLGWFNNTITSNVNIVATCNAVYNGAVNFYRSGGGCNNTGEIADVVQHEWGHGLDGNTRGGDGGTGEGTADVTAMHMTHSPLVGPGFRTTGAPVRNLDRNVSGLVTLSNAGSVCGGGVHCVGQAYGQTAWELSQALVAKHGEHTGWRTSERLFFTSLPDAGSLDPSSTFPIYDAYLNADDDDGNLANGTPNAAEIYTAFNDHEIANAQVPTSLACSRPGQPDLIVTPTCDRFDLSWDAVGGAQQYEVFRAEVRLDSTLFPVATLEAFETSYSDSEVAPGTDYWYVVMAVSAGDCESLIENPVTAKLTAQPVLSVDAAIDDDTPRGNRSGFADPGEEVDVVLTLTNVGDVDATAVSGTLIPTTPGVTLVGGSSTWPALPAGTSAVNETELRIQLDDGLVACGDVLDFQFVPDDATGCADDVSYFTIQTGEPSEGGFVCDDTPACFDKPTFAGLDTASPGSTCAQNVLGWSDAISNCINAELSYNVYRSTDPGFAPGAGNLVASAVASTSFVDDLLEPGQTYHYVVRAFDSRSGEEENTLVRSTTAPTSPDLQAPLFDGLSAADSGAGCGETVLSWTPAVETCSGPVSYEIYRSTDPGFTPGPATLIGSSLSASFVDAALAPGVSYTYVVRARDGVGNQETNALAVNVSATALDLVRGSTEFEPDPAGWMITLPDNADTGNWEWGDPQGTSFQPEDDATPDPGVNCWITGLGTGPSNNDVDAGTTTLLSESYDLSAAVNPAVRYSRYFTNDRGASPGEDPFVIEVSNDDGATFVPLETVGAGTPLAWVPVEIPLNGIIPPATKMRFRFTAADLGSGSLVEAGIDDFSVVDLGQGCAGCDGTPVAVQTIRVDRSGDDVVIDWIDDPAPGARFAVYKLGGSTFGEAIRVGTVDGRTFVHEGAIGSSESFFYRVTAVDACGGESALE